MEGPFSPVRGCQGRGDPEGPEPPECPELVGPIEPPCHPDGQRDQTSDRGDPGISVEGTGDRSENGQIHLSRFREVRTVLR